jgi:hypothetical protein
MSNDHVIVDEIRVVLGQDSRLPHQTEAALSEQAGTVNPARHRREPGSSVERRFRSPRRWRGCATSRMSSGSIHGIASPTIRSVVSRFRL